MDQTSKPQPTENIVVYIFMLIAPFIAIAALQIQLIIFDRRDNE